MITLSKKLFLIPVFAIVTSLTSSAQEQSYVLFNGTVITPNYTSFSNPRGGVAYFQFDDQYIVEIPAIKYIQYDTLRYRLAGLFKGNIQYQKRTLDGTRIDIYRQEYKKLRLSPFRNTESNKVEYFFEKNENTFKTINYGNLKWAINDDPESLIHLKKANKYRWVQIVSTVVASVAAITAIQRNEIGPPVGLISVSMISLIPIALVQKPKQRVLYETIDIYNRPR